MWRISTHCGIIPIVIMNALINRFSLKFLVILGGLIVALCIGLLLVMQGRAAINSNYISSQVTPTPIILSANILMEKVNAYRESMGLSTLKKSDRLCDIAKIRIVEVQENWSHEGFYAERFCKECTIGENLAKEYISEQSTLSNWIKSPSHREQMVTPYTHACVVTDKDYAVQIFGYY